MNTLSAAHLSAFEAALRRAGAGIVDALTPGLPEAEVREAFAHYPELQLPDELITWWGWHGGVDQSIDYWGTLGGRIGFLSPTQASTSHGEIQHEPSERGKLAWINSQDPWKTIDCDPTSESFGSVWAEHKGEVGQIFLPSLGALVEVWIDVLDRGIWTYPPGSDPQIEGDLISDHDARTWNAV